VTLSNTGLFKGDSGDQLDIEGTPIHNRDRLDSSWTEVGADYFKTLRIPLLLGREIDSSDAERATQVCVINEAFAREFYPGVNPIGRHITDLYPTTIETFEIVGIAGNAREHHPREAFKPRFYSNLAHPIGAVNGVTFLLSASGDPEAVAPSARRAVRQVDPALPVLRVETIDEALNRRLTTANMLARLATFFGFIAVFMAAVGLSGVISYSIARRTSEIGIRMALGASRLGVLRMVLSEALTMVVVGLAIGLPCALASGRFVATRLFGLKPSDPTSIAAAICVILVMALLGAYIPARRASRIDPAISLRQE
jgi:predicted permease